MNSNYLGSFTRIHAFCLNITKNTLENNKKTTATTTTTKKHQRAAVSRCSSKLQLHRTTWNSCLCWSIQPLNNMFKMKNRNYRINGEIKSTLREKTLTGHCLRSGVFIVDTEHISHLLPFLTLNMWGKFIKSGGKFIKFEAATLKSSQWKAILNCLNFDKIVEVWLRSIPFF